MCTLIEKTLLKSLVDSWCEETMINDIKSLFICWIAAVSITGYMVMILNPHPQIKALMFGIGLSTVYLLIRVIIRIKHN